MASAGKRSPLRAATLFTQAPAAFTTTGASMGPLAVSTPVTRPPPVRTPVTGQFCRRIAPWRFAPSAKPIAAPWGSA